MDTRAGPSDPLASKLPHSDQEYATFAPRGGHATADSALVPTAGIHRGWPAFWAFIILSGASTNFVMMIFPSLGLAAFHDGDADPCKGRGSASTDCQAASARFLAVSSNFTFLLAVLTILSSPCVGLLSDSVGRLPLMLGGMATGMAATLAVAAQYFWHTSIYLTFAVVLSTALLPMQLLANLWISDSAPPAARAVYFGIIVAVYDGEGVVCSLLGSLMHDREFVAASTMLACGTLLVGVSSLPESLPPGERRELRCSCDIVASAFASCVELCSNSARSTILLVNIVVVGCQSSLAGNFLVIMEERFGLDRQHVSPLMLFYSAVAIVSQLGLVRPLSSAVGLRGMLVAAVLCLAAGHGTFPFWGYWPCWVSTFLTGVGTIANAALWGLVVNSCPPGEQGRMLGAYISVLTLGQAFYGFCFTRAHAFFAEPRWVFDEPFPCFPIAAGALLELCVLAYFGLRWERIEEEIGKACSVDATAP